MNFLIFALKYNETVSLVMILKYLKPEVIMVVNLSTSVVILQALTMLQPVSVECPPARPR